MKRLPFFRRNGVTLLMAAVFILATAQAADIVRSGATAAPGTATTANAAAVPAGNAAGVAEAARPNAQARLNAARDAVTAVRAMQAAAAQTSRDAIKLKWDKPNQASASGAWNLGGNNGLVTSGVSANGLSPEGGALKDTTATSSDPTVTFVMPGSWKGVGGITQTTTTAAPGQDLGSGTASVVNVAQTQQQAILNWDKFNIAPDTTLNFDQTLGGADVRNWIAFNKVGVTGNPSQILGSLKTLGPKDSAGNYTTGGQVYVINPNGIIFGGTAQVNAHAFVASSLPINDNLIARGLLNNPDGQFLFTGVLQAAGSQTDAFTPTVSDVFALDVKDPSHQTKLATIASITNAPTNVTVSFSGAGASGTLVAGDDYALSRSSTTGKATVTFTAKGLTKLAPDGSNNATSARVTVNYTPTADSYGDISVQPGALFNSPTSADHVGGRVALFGPNVTNAGTITSPDGQIILAAGLQVGVAAHLQDDPSLRGLDIFVGKVSDASFIDQKYSTGTATNDRIVNDDKSVTMGLLETTDLLAKDSDGKPLSPQDVPGAISMVGKRVDQLGVINSVTTVAFNGRVDLLANYNATGNANYDSTNPLRDPTVRGSSPFLYPSVNLVDSSKSTGVITLGPGSLTQIMPSDSLTNKINNTQDVGVSLPSQINLRGLAINLASDLPDAAASVPANALAATIRAPNARVNLSAGVWNLSGAREMTTNQFYFSGGQVYLDRGTLIDVAGTQDAPASVTENIVDAQLRGNELADSPLQRDGALRGKTVQVDLRVHGPWDPNLNNGLGDYTWVGTPVGDVSGWIGLVQRTAGELTTNGGLVSIQAGGSVVMQPGSKIDVSGGWITYAGGHIYTTQVVSNGHLFDISQATPDRVYTGIFDGKTTTADPKWGVTTTTSNTTLLGYDDPGYIQGGAGGKISITAPSVALDGGFSGQTWSGSRQVMVNPTAGNDSFVAKPSEFQLTFLAQSLIGGTIYNISPMPPNVFLRSADALAKDSPVSGHFMEDSSGAYPLDIQRQDEVDLAPNLVNSNGFGFLTINNGDDNRGTNGRKNDAGEFGDVIIPASVANPRDPVLTFAPASALGTYLKMPVLNLIGANIGINGGVIAPGGLLRFRAVDISESGGNITISSLIIPVNKPNPNRGALTLGSGVTLDVAGQAIDYRLAATNPSSARTIVGGTVSLTGYQTQIEGGASIDVSGGAMINTSDKVLWGAAGSVSIAANNEQQFDGAKLVLPATYTGDPSKTFALRGYSGSVGGEFDLTAPLIQITSLAAVKTGRIEPLTADSILLDAALFSQGGFAKFNITGIADSSHPDAPALFIGPADVPVQALPSTSPTVTPPLEIKPVVKSYQTNLAHFGAAALEIFSPEAPFQSPVQLSFNAAGLNLSKFKYVGGLVLDDNALIQLNPNAASAVSFNGDTSTLLGKVFVPGGKIDASGGKSTVFPGAADPATVALSTVYIGPKSVLSTHGDALLSTVDDGLHRVGTILKGGDIRVKGNIVAEKGAVLDASGTSGSLDLSLFQTALDPAVDTSNSGPRFVRTTVESDGGSISLTGVEELFTDATLVAAAGGVHALGGTLNVGSGIVLGSLVIAPADSYSLAVKSSGATLPVSFAALGKTSIGQAVLDKDGHVLSNSIYINSDKSTQNLFGGAIAASSFRFGGFDRLNFTDSIQFSGRVSINAGSSITFGTGPVLVGDGSQPSSLTLNAPYVALGMPFSPPGNFLLPTGKISPVNGIASLSVTGARLVDIGNLSLQKIGTASIATTQGGDIRGNGTLEMAGDLTLTAGQIYPPSATTFNIAAYDSVSLTDHTAQKGSITIKRAGTPQQTPLSAGGELNLYASIIVQNGTLRAPMGSIHLGRSDRTPSDPITQGLFPKTDQITLVQGSLTSVSTSDPSTGAPLSVPIPYGNNLNGTSWIDPTGTDITVNDPSSRTAKRVELTATTIDDQKNSSVDISGGGDLYAYRFVAGVNGKKDILGLISNQSFAVLPGYNSLASPYAPFNSSAANFNNGLVADPGYVSTKLSAGDSIYLDLNNGRGAQVYTLLPARYALLPGAYLITQKATVPSGTVKQADGSMIVAGYRYNTLNSTRAVQPIYTSWEVATGGPDPGSIVHTRAQYDNYSANLVFTSSAAANDSAVRRLPIDAGQLVLAVTESLMLKGKINAAADGTPSSRGGLIDIASPQDILISGANTDLTSIPNTELVLNAGDLSGFGAESLLIGGRRTFTPEGTVVDVTSNQIKVDNGPARDLAGHVRLNTAGQPTKPGTPLTGSEIILTANENLELAPGADIEQSGKLTGAADALIIHGSITLNSADNTAGGKTFAVYNGGVPIAFPQGTPAGKIKPDVDYTVIRADGTSLGDFTAGTETSIDVGSTITLATRGNIVLLSNSTTTPSQAMIALGDGAALWISSDPSAQMMRSAVVYSSSPSIVIGAGAKITGSSVSINSTSATVIDQSAQLGGFKDAVRNSLSITSGRIGLTTDHASLDAATFAPFDQEIWTLLSADQLNRMTTRVLPTQTDALTPFTSLALSSYSSVYLGGGADAQIGGSSLENLELHAAEIRGFGNVSQTFTAKSSIVLDNILNGSSWIQRTGLSDVPGNTIAFHTTDNVGTVQLGAHQLTINKYSSVDLKAAGGVLLGAKSAGSFKTDGDLSITAPVITSVAGADETIVAAGAVSLLSSTGTPSVAGGLGARVSVIGSSVKIDTNITLPSGLLALSATQGDLNVGGMLSVAGQAKTFNDVVRYTGAGRISLTSDQGAVAIGKTGVLDVSAAFDVTQSDATSRLGDAGEILVSAVNGKFTLEDGSKLYGRGGLVMSPGSEYAPGAGGSFFADLGRMADLSTVADQTSLKPLSNALNAGGFFEERSVRVRTGDVKVEGTAIAHRFSLSADQGAITVAGVIDASGDQGGTVNIAGQPSDAFGNRGGSIALAAHGNVVLDTEARLTVAAADFNAAGKGGTVSLEAGSSQGGVAPSTNDSRGSDGVFVKKDTPVVDIRSKSIVDLSVGASSVGVTPGKTLTLPEGTFRDNQVMTDFAGTITAQNGGTILLNGMTTILAAVSTVAFKAGSAVSVSGNAVFTADASNKNEGTLTFTGGGHGGSIPVTLSTGQTVRLNPTTTALAQTVVNADAALGRATGTLHLRAPQTNPTQPSNPMTPRLLPDVQINPINGTILNPSSIVVEGYRVYSPTAGAGTTAGYIDTVESAIDADGRKYADNTTGILASITKSWSPSLNGALSTTAGDVLHVRPGAEVVGAANTSTTTTLTFSRSASPTFISISAGATVLLPDTTDPSKGVSVNKLTFASAAVLVPVDVGNYTASYTLSPTALTSFDVLSATTVSVTSNILANTLGSTVDGVITFADKSTQSFVAGTLPALLPGSAITFSKAGTLLYAAKTGSVSLTANGKFEAGKSINLPASSVVDLTTKGGSVTFATAGNLTWTSAQSASNLLAVQLPSNSAFTTSTGAKLATTGNGSSMTLVRSTTVGADLTLAADSSLFLPQGTIVIPSASNVINSAQAIQVGPSTTPSSPFEVEVKSAQGGTITFRSNGTITTQKGGTRTLANQDLTSSGVQLGEAGGAITFSQNSTITSTVAGTIVLASASIDSNGLSAPGAGSAITVPVRQAAGALSSTAEGKIVTPGGVVISFSKGLLPEIPAGSTITIAGGKLTSSSAISVSVNANLAAGVPTDVSTNGVVKLTGAGTIATTVGSASVSIANNIVPNKITSIVANEVVTLASTADIAAVQTASAFDLMSIRPITVRMIKGNTTSGKISLARGAAGGLMVAVPTGAYTTTGAAIIPQQSGAGDLVLASNWDLSSYRYGPQVDLNKPGSGEPGILTLRAAGNLIFKAYPISTATSGTNNLFAASLSDGFGPPVDNGSLWQAPLLPSGSASWSYRLVAGSDLSAADFHQVLPVTALPLTSGSIQLGLGAPKIPIASGTVPNTTSIIPPRFQTIRTGTGDISVAAGRDLQLLNPIATIYTAGRQASSTNSVLSPDDFDTPNTLYRISSTATVPALQQFSPVYPNQYSTGGGDVSVFAQGDISHLSIDQATGKLIDDSSKEMPTNWLYRRGYVDPLTGKFGVIETAKDNSATTSEIASTTWWVDFSNFFEGIGALGGGNVTLAAGGSVRNVDVVVPTNARMTKQTPTGDTVAAHQTLLQLGGGDLRVTTGADIDGGVYYVERGLGTLTAKGSIHTNATRMDARSTIDPITWLPTTLFLGQGSFDVSAIGQVLLGAAVNPFLLPQGINNSYYQRTVFSTFSSNDAVRVSSLEDDVTLREGDLANSLTQSGSLLGWYRYLLAFDGSNLAVNSQPWLRLSDRPGDVGQQGDALRLFPASTEVISFSENINLINGLTTFPSATGNLDFLAARSINGFQKSSLINGGGTQWSPSTLILSDADAKAIPEINTPAGLFRSARSASVVFPASLADPAVKLRESGATAGNDIVLQRQLALHGARPDDDPTLDSHALHGGDARPMHLIADSGDISGLALFSAKTARISAGKDITDVGFYIQNTQTTDVSVVSAGRDILSFDPNSPLRVAASASLNSPVISRGPSQTGDIQIGGPGTLEVLAGHEINLGSPVQTNDPNYKPTLGQAVGIASVGNIRNPRLPFAGADVVVGAGLGSPHPLDTGTPAQLPLNFVDDPKYSSGFIDAFLNPNTGGAIAARHLPELGKLMGFTIDDKNPPSQNAQIWAAFTDPHRTSSAQQGILTLNIFYAVLGDAGRDFNNKDAVDFGNYNEGYEAIAALFKNRLDFTDPTKTGFIDLFLNPNNKDSLADQYLPTIGSIIGSTGTPQELWSAFSRLSTAQQSSLALKVFAQVLDDAAVAGRGADKAAAAAAKTRQEKALGSLFDHQTWQGEISLSSRSIRTSNGGDISLFAPGGGVSLGSFAPQADQPTPGIVTEHGGAISVFTHDNVDVGNSRIFTLRGGDEMIWSSVGNIAAGVSSKTVQAAPPTRVLVDPQSADVKTDLAGLATGGGIGVLASVAGVPPADVNLIAPAGTVDAGDAGIRASGNLNIAALHVVNAGNIQVGGTSVGTPPPPAPPNIAGLTSAANTGAAADAAADEVARRQAAPATATELPSLITVEVLDYGGGEGGDLHSSTADNPDDEEKKKRKLEEEIK